MGGWLRRRGPVVEREPVVLVEPRAMAREVAYRRLAETDEPTAAILADYLEHVGAS